MYEENFWAFETMSDLVRDDPESAWPILLTMISRAKDDCRLGNLAAGPLEDLLQHHGEAFLERVAAEAAHNANLRTALSGVWLFSSPIYPRYLELMRELGMEAI